MTLCNVFMASHSEYEAMQPGVMLCAGQGQSANLVCAAACGLLSALDVCNGALDGTSSQLSDCPTYTCAVMIRALLQTAILSPVLL